MDLDVENIAGRSVCIACGRKKERKYWSNFKIKQMHVANIPGFIDLNLVSDKKVISDWLGIDAGENIYLKAKNPIQVYRNCVHPLIGQSIFNDAFGLK